MSEIPSELTSGVQLGLLREAQVRIAVLERDLRRAKNLIRQLEWTWCDEGAVDSTGEMYCYVCGSTEEHGHVHGCPLAEAIR